MALIVKKLCLPWLFLIVIIAPANAQNKPLRVAVAGYTSPFVLQGKNQLYGFDISLMNYVCTSIKRDCQYQLMRFDQLLPAVQSKQVDVAISSIIITKERYQQANFSLPYMVSNTRFLGKSSIGSQPITLKLLKNSTIGGLKGTVTDEEVQSLAVIKPKISYFDREEELIAALANGSIDLALVDQPTAIYWQYHSSGKLIAIGKPINYGFGLGIAVNPEDPELLKDINEAVLKFQNSEEFKSNYTLYLGYF